LDRILDYILHYVLPEMIFPIIVAIPACLITMRIKLKGEIRKDGIPQIFTHTITHMSELDFFESNGIIAKEEIYLLSLADYETDDVINGGKKIKTKCDFKRASNEKLLEIFNDNNQKTYQLLWIQNQGSRGVTIRKIIDCKNESIPVAQWPCLSINKKGGVGIIIESYHRLLKVVIEYDNAIITYTLSEINGYINSLNIKINRKLLFYHKHR
jgi:hypothetical protein